MSIIGSNILAGASGQGVGGYTIETSLRFRSSASAYLSRTPASAGNRKTWTWSGWVKRGTLGASQYLFFAYNANSDAGFFRIELNSTDTIRVRGWSTTYVETSAVYRDPSAWYHVVLVADTSQAQTLSNQPDSRVRLYVNGEQVTTFSASSMPSQNTDLPINNNIGHTLSSSVGYSSGAYFDGYLTEVNFIDGQALDPSSFGEYNADTGVWQPTRYAGTYGTNGFYLPFSDATTTTTLGADSSGNGNDWTTHNISLTAGVTYDSMTDTPTPYADGGNYAMLNPLDKGTSLTPAEGNLYGGGGNAQTIRGTVFVSSGKWYWEVTCTALSSGHLIGVATNASSLTSYVGSDANGYGYASGGSKYHNGTGTSYGASWTTSDIIGVALDLDAGTITFYKNNVSQGVAFTGLSGVFAPAYSSGTGSHVRFNFGQRPFAYTPPTGFLPLHTGNLPDSNIVDGSQYFDISLSTTGTTTQGGGVAKVISGLAFQPDLVFSKNRSSSANARWGVIDSVRGVNKTLATNITDAEVTSRTDLLTSFNSDGVNIGADAAGYGWNWNQQSGASDAYAYWLWKAGGTGVTNTAGSITSTVSANPTAGFSIVSFTTNNTAGATVGHSLGAVPAVIIVKYRNLTGTNWVVYHKNMSATPQNSYLNLNTTAGIGTSSDPWNNTAPTISVITLGSGVGSASSTNYGTYNSVAYCFAEVEGYSKFGSYLGNNSSDGVFVYLGFRPRFLMIKSTSAGTEWVMIDTERSSYNLSDTSLYANRAYSEATITAVNDVDILSNGFKLRNNTGYVNASQTYVYMAFAETDFAHALAR